MGGFKKACPGCQNQRCFREKTIAMWPSVRRGEESYIFPYQEEADIMFNSALIYEISVLKMYAEPLLYSIGRMSRSIRKQNAC